MNKIRIDTIDIKHRVYGLRFLFIGCDARFVNRLMVALASRRSRGSGMAIDGLRNRYEPRNRNRFTRFLSVAKLLFVRVF